VTNGTFINIITDDELGYYFSHIPGKGKCLIFESCLSGGLVDKKTLNTEELPNYHEVGESTLFQTDFLRDINHPGAMDVNRNNTIVMMLTLPHTLGLATFSTHSPLLYSVATIINNSEKYDKNNDGFLSAEEIFRITRPMTLIQSSFYWIYVWVIAYLFFKFDLYKLYSSFVPWFLPRIIKLYHLFDMILPIPMLSGTCLFLLFYMDQQILVKLRTGHYFLNWPNMQDDYPGELPLVQL
jgi:hypothetical protein